MCRSLLTALDGRTIRRFNGQTVVLRTAGARIVPVAMTLRQRVLSAIAHPNIAYLLLSLGMLGLTIELWSPGAILPGVVGGVSLLLAFFALQLLPVNFAGLLLILLGLLLLALEIKVTSYRPADRRWTGQLAVRLDDSHGLRRAGATGELQRGVSRRVRIRQHRHLAGEARTRRRSGARRSPASPGWSDRPLSALTAIEPDLPGRVLIHGENWQATAGEAIPEGARVHVTNIEGLTLVVRKD